MATNVQGTLNLLEAAVEAQVDRYVFTSTTSLMISEGIRAGREGGARRAAWITEVARYFPHYAELYRRRG